MCQFKKTVVFALMTVCVWKIQFARADFVFGHATSLGTPVNSGSIDSEPAISADGLSLYFMSWRNGGSGSGDIWVATRATPEDAWEDPRNLGPDINHHELDKGPCVSADGLTLYFESFRYNGTNNWPHIYTSTRPTTDDLWDSAGNLGPVNRECGAPCISVDGLSLFFHSDRQGSIGPVDLYVATRPSLSDYWGETKNLGVPINSTSRDMSPHVSSDGRVLFFDSERPGGFGVQDIWMTMRETEDGDWGPPINLGPTICSPSGDFAPCVSFDGSTLYFTSTRAGSEGGYGLWQAPIHPVVDFTGDYRVDVEDLLLLIEHWGHNNPAYDMGPMPWGDGVIDRADLEVLMSYWGQEVYNPHLLAHWKVDEIEGDVAYDSAAENHATVIGDAAWQPDSGQVDGALQLDGIDDCIDTQFKLDPDKGPFSVFAWVKGGAPGQVIIAQDGGANWLLVHADGTLMTELTTSRGRQVGPLYSEAIVTDGNWHRIGLVRNESQRTLLVDDVIVAQDDHDTLKSASGSLYIGAGQAFQSDMYWQGLVDDVRVYDRVVVP